MTTHDSVKHKPAAVIGSGFGGLALAIRLQAAGWATTIYEKRDMPGGRAYVYRDQGFVFDAGPTLLTAPECLEELFTLAGRNIEDYVKLVPLNIFYQMIWDDGYVLNYNNNRAFMEEQIRKKNPEDIQGIQNFQAYSKKVYEAGYTNLAAKTFPSIFSMLKCAPQLMGLRAERSVFSTVSKYIQDPHLREAFSFHPLLIGGSPYRASAIYTLINWLEFKGGVWFAMGGTGALVNAFVKLFQDIGGTLHLNAEVDEIKTEAKKVKSLVLKSGENIPCDIVVSNADILHTYGHLFRNTPSQARTGKKFSRMDQSPSLFVVYFGTKKQYPKIEHHTILFGPRYKGLLDDIFINGVVAEDFSLYLHRPTATDPSLAPEGCDSFYVLSPVPHLQKTGNTVDWSVEGPRYAEKILNALEEKIMPGLKENIVTQSIFTPLNFRDDLNSPVGSAFSLEPTLLQSAYWRAHNKDKSIKGFYLVGAGTHPGAGVPGVINSGKATASVILNDYRTKST